MPTYDTLRPLSVEDVERDTIPEALAGETVLGPLADGPADEEADNRRCSSAIAAAIWFLPDPLGRPRFFAIGAEESGVVPGVADGAYIR
jgi:hypothetical protein